MEAKQEEAGLRMGIEISREALQSQQPPVSPTQQPKENE
jgi:hypothetical protein